MTNGDAMLTALTIDDLVTWIQERYCADGKCSDGCPVSRRCNEIFDMLYKDGGNPSGADVIRFWLNDGRDYIFYSHEPSDKHKPAGEDDCQYRFRNRCNICGRPTNTYGLARIAISGGNQSYKLIGKVCEDCFPKVCKTLKIKKPDFVEPYFELQHMLKKQGSGTYCGNCGKKSQASYNYCPKCGEMLDK